MLSKKARNIKTSPTLALVAMAKELQSKGHPVISLTVGEPDWATFPVARDAGVEAIITGNTKYTPANGTLDFRKELSKKLEQELGIQYSPSEIVVGPGAKFIIFSALQMLCDEGDEVIIQAPYWVSYPTMIELAGAVPKIILCDEKEKFKLSAEKLESHISARTKAFLFCSPSNPTGLSYTKEEISEIAQVLKRHPQVTVISDDIYNRLNFDGSPVAPHLLHVAPELKDRIVAINGGSKAYSMTGWRIGWGAGPSSLIKAMGDYQSQATGAPSTIAQFAAQKALFTSDHEITKVVQLLIDRKNKSIESFKKIPEMKISNPDGAFYLWVDIRALMGRSYKGRVIRTDKDFCDVLLNEYFVATVPGLECGVEGFMRLSFATTESQMAEAIDRMQRLVQELK